MNKSGDPEFGSQANLVKNEQQNEPKEFKKHGSLKRTASKTSEFETVRPEQKVLTADEKVGPGSFKNCPALVIWLFLPATRRYLTLHCTMHMHWVESRAKSPNIE
jgi:hypothetical protein